ERVACPPQLSLRGPVVTGQSLDVPEDLAAGRFGLRPVTEVLKDFHASGGGQASLVKPAPHGFEPAQAVEDGRLDYAVASAPVPELVQAVEGFLDWHWAVHRWASQVVQRLELLATGPRTVGLLRCPF